MPFSASQIRGLLYSACRKATAEGTTLIDILGGMVEGAFEPALEGEGLGDIVSTSNAGQSVTTSTGNGAPTRTDTGEAAGLLLQLANQCLAGNPGLTGEALCACVAGKLPLRGVRSFRNSYHAMGPWV